MSRLAVLIADDEPQLRTLVTRLLASEPDVEVVGSVADAAGAIEFAGRTQPDVALVDVRMPGGGVSATQGILERSPHTRVVAFTAYDDRHIVIEMLRAGATSYLLKGAVSERIVETVQRAARGESVLSAQVAGGVIDELTTQIGRQQAELDARQQLLERIRRTIAEHEFETVFQPIVDLHAGHTVGVEALSRFPARPVRPPQEWFADAADAGLGGDLELAAAAAALEHLQEIGRGAFLSINFSPETLARSLALVHRDGAPGRVVVEITEHAAIDDYGALEPIRSMLRDSGVRVAVDDAGAGFASLRHALQLTPDFIKLDVTLTQGIDSDPRRRALARGLIDFAGELDAAIIAEGIETRAELETLRSLGVSYGQGYYLAPPAPLPTSPVLH